MIVPVHTTGQGWFKERFENVVVPEEGKTFPLNGGGAIRY